MKAYISGIVFGCISVLAISCGESNFSSDQAHQDLTSDSGKIKVSQVVDEGVPKPQEEQDRIDTAVRNSKCDQSEKKIYICHYPPGNIENSHTLCISTKALKAHVGVHGSGDDLDYVGKCDEEAGSGDDGNGNGETETPGDNSDGDGDGNCSPGGSGGSGDEESPEPSPRES